MYILGIDPAKNGIHWAWLHRDTDGVASCPLVIRGKRGFGSHSSKRDALLLPCWIGRTASSDFSVAIEDFTFIGRGMGGPAIETCVNIGRVAAECIAANIFFYRITRQRVKGFFGITGAKQKRTMRSGRQTEIDCATRQAIRQRGIDTHFMSRHNVDAIAVALTMEKILREDKLMEGVA